MGNEFKFQWSFFRSKKGPSMINGHEVHTTVSEHPVGQIVHLAQFRQYPWCEVGGGNVSDGVSYWATKGKHYPATREYTYLLLLISMLWHRQAIFESKGDKVSSSAECRIRTQGLRHLFASRLNACWHKDWAIEDQAKNLKSTARPYDQQAFSPLDLTASWLSHLALAIYMFVVVNFDALAQASDIRIERRQVVFLCWMQDSNQRQTPCNKGIYLCRSHERNRVHWWIGYIFPLVLEVRH